MKTYLATSQNKNYSSEAVVCRFLRRGWSDFSFEIATCKKNNDIWPPFFTQYEYYEYHKLDIAVLRLHRLLQNDNDL